MPVTQNLDPISMKKLFERENAPYRGLDWEIEDLISEPFLVDFLSEEPAALRRPLTINGKTHR